MDLDVYVSTNHRATEQGNWNCKAVLEEEKKQLEEKLINALWEHSLIVDVLLNFITTEREISERQLQIQKLQLEASLLKSEMKKFNELADQFGRLQVNIHN
ncbi:unnamed protein product [Allacma fusca]|uniref:Uncharacterized protein n=1 Tax=Allacma fusca TaxID=39272 RepID=A0A8J2JSR3_9HEXA|nr:unnamed protein product [Allacma fusca]